MEPCMSGSNWCRTEFEISKTDLEWNVQVPCLETTTQWMEPLDSTLFSAKSTPDRQWKMQLSDMATDIKIQLFLTTPGIAHYNSARIVDPVRAKFSILNRKRQKILQLIQALPRQSGGSFIFQFSKEKILQSECQQLEGSLTFYCEIESYTKKEPNSGQAEDVQDQPMRNSSQLIDELEKLFENMKYADVTFITSGRKFLAHKAILASRSPVFDAMFEHPTKEKLSNQVEITDIHPDVFRELLRFIYTGRLTLKTMEMMAVGLHAAADKYLLDRLKADCEDHLIRRMSPENCIQLLLNADQQNATEDLIAGALEFFRLHQRQVMITDSWKKAKKGNPVKLCEIQEMLHHLNSSNGTSSSGRKKESF